MLARKREVILGPQQLRGKILSRKDLAASSVVNELKVNPTGLASSSASVKTTKVDK
jgi:hypothetical protein